MAFRGLMTMARPLSDRDPGSTGTALSSAFPAMTQKGKFEKAWSVRERRPLEPKSPILTPRRCPIGTPTALAAIRSIQKGGSRNGPYSGFHGFGRIFPDGGWQLDIGFH
jgi:hypothetical protein